MYLSKFLGSSSSLPAHGRAGARATSSLAAHFALQNTASNSAEKKGSPSEGVAEGGGRGEEFRHARAEVKRFRRLALSQTSKQNNFQILLRKIWRAGVKKLKENCFAGWRGFRATAGLASLLGVLLKKSSNINQKTPPIFTFCEIVRISLGAKRLGMVFFRNLKGIFEIAKERAVGNAEVRRAKLWQNEILQTNLFSFAKGERLSVFLPQGTLSCFAIHLVFDCPKANFKTIWTT